MQCLLLLVCLLVATGIAQDGGGDQGTCTDPVPSCDVDCDNGSCALDSCLKGMANSACQYITIRLNKTTYNLSTAIDFSNRGHFELVGCVREECVNETMIECVGNNAGLFLQNITRVTVRHIGFSHCNFDIAGMQAAHNQNSSDDDHAALYVECVERLVLDTITITETHGVGLMLYFVNTAEVSNSTFTANGLKEKSHDNSSGGVHVFAPWTNSCRRQVEGIYSHCQQNGLPVSSYRFASCRFQNNCALGVPIDNTPHTPYSDTYVSGHGGGLSFYLTDHTQYATIEVSSCTFQNNEALFGAGLSIFIHGAASHNTIRITDTNFSDNSGYTYSDGLESGGGGAQVMFTTHLFNGTADITNNSVTFQGCNFANNNAYWGGGLSVVSDCEHVAKGDTATNCVRIEECQWSGNRARLGSAIDCVSWAGVQGGVLPVVTLKDNQIYNNTVNYDKEAKILVAGTGTLYSDSITINLEGSNTFAHNLGSGITAVDAIVNFTARSDTKVACNTGIKGGGLSLFGKATLMLCAGSNVKFDQNYAKLMGGAIFYRLSGPRNLITSQKCFIQYEDQTLPPERWNTTVTFSCNHAFMDGHSVFASSLLPCIWTGGYHRHGFIAKQGNLTDHLRKVFRWSNTTFVFSNTDCNRNSSSIHTEISTDTLSADSEIEHIEASPGILLDQEKYSKYVHNELGDESYSVFRGDSLNISAGNVQATGRYISRMRIQFNGKPYDNFQVRLTTPWTLSYIIKSKVNLTACPPGFRMMTKDNENRQCVCAVGSSNHYRGIMSCNSVGKESHAQLQKSYWAGYLRKDDTGTYYKLCSESEVKYSPQCHFATGRCLRGFCSTAYDSLSNTTSLPATPSNYRIKQAICNGQHRSGILCGKCRRGYGYNINNVRECIPCNSSNETDYVVAGMIWITVRFLPLTIMVAVFLLFDIDILSGSMQSFILYSQMLHFLSPMLNKTLNFKTTGVKEIQDVSFMLYDIWRLEFVNSIVQEVMARITQVCAEHLSSLAMLSLEYLPAGYPLSLIFGLWCLKGLHDRIPGHLCAPCCRLFRKPYVMLLRLRRKWSPNSTIIHGLSAFIVFSYSNFLAISVYLVTPSWLQIFEGEEKCSYRVAFDGNMPYGGNEHRPYMIGAILVLLTFVAIPPLILILVPLVPRAAVHFQPERSNRVIWLCDKMFSGPKWQFFLDAFQGGFKPRYSFFAGLFFLYRIAITVTYSFTITLEWQYFIHTGEVVLFLVIHSLCQPYRRKIYNIVDTLIYFNMLAVLQIGSFMWQQSHNGEEIPKFVFWLALVVMNIPQGCFIGYLVYKIAKGIRTLVIMQKVKRKLRESQRWGRQVSEEERDLELLNDSFQLRIDYAELSDDFACQMAL